MTNAIEIYEKFDSLQRAATALQASGYFADVKSQAQAIVKVMAGAELGLPPFASMTGIHIIQGKPALGANVIATLVKNDPRYDYRIVTCTDTACTLSWFEAGQKVGESSFTMQEANAAGLTGKDNWRKFPSDMLFARAITRGARRFAPGIFGGAPVYTPEELGADVDPEGYVETTARDVTAEPQPTPQERADQAAADLGFAPAPTPLDLAKAVTASDGRQYGDMTTEELSHHANGIADGLKKNISPEKRKELEHKRDAIALILNSRNQ